MSRCLKGSIYCILDEPIARDFTIAPLVAFLSSLLLIMFIKKRVSLFAFTFSIKV